MSKDNKTTSTSSSAEKKDVGTIQKAISLDPMYKAKELVENAVSVFGVKPECVEAALKVNNIEECSVNEAKEILFKYLKKEVK